MKDQTKEHIRACAPCKIGLAKFNEPVTMQPIAVQGIYHKVGIDMIGPIQTSASNNKYIITAIDYMSKNIEAAAVSNKHSKTTAEFLFKDIVCRHGTPVEVVTDQGGEFLGEFQALLDKCGIDHRLTSAYHPQANGLTERANQTLVESFIKMTKEDPLNWDKQIPTVLMGYRATRQASTKYSPFFMLHGHEMVLPIHNKGRTVDAEYGENSELFSTELFGPSVVVLDKALANITVAQNKQMANYASKQLHGAVAPPQNVPENAGPSDASVAVETPSHHVDTHTTAKTVTETTPSTTAPPPTLPSDAVLTDIPSTSTSIVPGVTPAKESIPPVLETPTVTVKQEHPDPWVRRKRVLGPTLNEGDFVLIKIHKMVRKDGERKGKLVPKAEGPYMLKSFTDTTRQVARIADANDRTWTKRVADLSKWT